MCVTVQCRIALCNMSNTTVIWWLYSCAFVHAHTCITGQSSQPRLNVGKTARYQMVASVAGSLPLHTMTRAIFTYDFWTCKFHMRAEGARVWG